MSEVTEALKGSPILSEVWIPGMKQEERTTECEEMKEKSGGEPRVKGEPHRGREMRGI